MSSSPAKRRKSNTSRAIAVDASNTAQGDPQHTGERQSLGRASFQSPTKASLARSHPHVLARALSRSAAEKVRRSSQRRQGEFAEANEETLSGIPDDDPSQLDAASNAVPSSRSQLAPSVGRPSSDQFQSQPRTASQSEQQGLRASPVETGDSVPENAVDKQDGPREQPELNEGRSRSLSSGEDRGEPELPPTPTELGLERLATRSKGPLSSSPSWQHEMRKRKWRKATEDLNSSPLKLKAARSDVGFANNTSRAQGSKSIKVQLSEEVREKQRIRDKLRAQLERLRTELSELEHEARRTERPHDYPQPGDAYFNRLMDLLVSRNPSCAPTSPKPAHAPSLSSALSFLLPFSGRRFISRIEPEPPPSPHSSHHFRLQQPSDAVPYLTLFAPVSLVARTMAISSYSAHGTVEGRSSFAQRVNLTFCAPPEYPTSSYQVPLEVCIDPQKHCVVSISVGQSTGLAPMGHGRPSIPDPLKRWMDFRLSDPRLKLDISGLCWGICRYWEAAVSRAKVWVELESLLSRMRGDTHPPQRSETSRVSDRVEYSPRTLCPHLARTHLVFSFPDENKQPQLLLTCALNVDIWTSEPQLLPDVCVSRSHAGRHNGEQAEREARKVFWSALKNHGEVDADGLIKAAEAVISSVFE